MSNYALLVCILTCQYFPYPILHCQIPHLYPNVSHVQSWFSLQDGDVLSRQTLQSIANEDVDISLSDAAQCIEWLDAQVESKHLRYMALYHDVTDTSLLLIGRAQKREELLKKKMRAAQMRKDEAERQGKQTKPLPKKFTLTAREMESLAGDLAHKEDLGLYFKGKLKDGQVPETKYLGKMQELLDLGATLDTVHEELTVGTKVLLGVAWSREDERQLFEKYPTLLLFDVTYQTNREKRPLGIVAGVDGNMKVFTPVRVFMPSEQGWVFDWIFKSVIPTLLGKEALKRTSVVMTDGDRTMYSQFDRLQTEFYPNAIHVLCMFHLINKGLERIKRQLVRRDKTAVKELIESFKHTLFTWCRLNDVETMEEFNTSRVFLENWLTELQRNEHGEVDEHVSRNSTVLLHFLRNNILPHQGRFLVFHRNDRLYFDYRSNSALESMNQSMKVTCDPKVTPNMTLLLSMQVQDLQRTAAMDLRKKKALQNYNRYGTWAPGSETIGYVQMKCESWIGQHCGERDKYNCRLCYDPSDGYHVLLLRKPGESGYYCRWVAVHLGFDMLVMPFVQINSSLHAPFGLYFDMHICAFMQNVISQYVSLVCILTCCCYFCAKKTLQITNLLDCILFFRCSSRECTAAVTCPACSRNSPITRFRRLRKIIFKPLFPGKPDTPYEVICSCAFYPAVGVPCHHFCLFLTIMPWHVHIRFHLDFDALWRRKGCEDKQMYFRQRLRNNKLIINHQEYKEIIERARINSSPQEVFDVPLSVPMQKNQYGMLVQQSVTSRRVALSSAALMEEDTFNQGGLSQEMHAPADSDDEALVGDLVGPTAPANASQPQDLTEFLSQMMARLVIAHGDDAIGREELVSDATALYRRHMGRAQAMNKGTASAISPTPTKKNPHVGKKALTGFNRDIDRAKAGKRWRSKNEPKRVPKKKSKKTALTKESYINK